MQSARTLYFHQWPIFPHYFTKWHDFRGGFEHKMCVLILSTTFV